MRILITNDDGIMAPGLEVLTEIATTLAGPTGSVTCVAPAFEQSGVGHCISYTQPAMISEHGPGRFAVQGAPADCVMAALHHVMDSPPDLVLSGINSGNNAGENTLYSGTVGAAMEGALQGVKSIALSAYIGPENARAGMFDAARTHGVNTVRHLLNIWPDDDDTGYGLFWNVNFPPVMGDQVQGLRLCPQGYRGHGQMHMVPAETPNRRSYLWITGRSQQEPTAPGTDVANCLEGWISATPMRADLTDHAFLAQLEP